MRSIKTTLITALLCNLAYSDYAWIPRFQELYLKGGWEFLKSSENFDTDGLRTPLVTVAEDSELYQHCFFIDGEYGISPDWAIRARSGIANAATSGLNTGTAIASGTSIADTYLAVKYAARDSGILITPEIGLSLATDTDTGKTASDLVVGEGISTTVTVVNFGYRLSPHWVAALSPAVHWRFSGYSPQFVLDGAVSFIYRPAFVRLFWNAAWTLNKEIRATVLTTNPAIGSGGSFSRLSENRDIVWIGARAGYRLAKGWTAEAMFAYSLMGHEAGQGFRVGVNLSTAFDFYEEDPGPKFQEVPLDENEFE